MPALSVIICTHNPRRDYLDRTLESLRAQTLPSEKWELLLVDNASKEPLATSVDLSWHPQGRHVLETSLGLTPARLCGIRAAASDLLLFVDDDNILQPDYLAVLLQLAADNPQLACFGAGRLEPEFEQQPAPEYMSRIHYLALRTVASPQWSNVPGDCIIPWGAGLAVRRAVAERVKDVVGTCPVRKQLDRVGQNLLCGGDDEFTYAACDMGFGKGLFPALRITHLIAARRVTPDYLMNLARGRYFSRVLMNYAYGEPLPEIPPDPTLRYALGNIFRSSPGKTIRNLLNWYRYRQKSPVERAYDDTNRQAIADALDHLRKNHGLKTATR
jgi:glycosyltransferase involved in cell wall biosynthesis